MIQNLHTSVLNDAPQNANSMDPGKLAALTDALREAKKNGSPFKQPILVRPISTPSGALDYYEIVDGHHRVAAAKAAGYEELPCVVVEMTDTEAMLAAIQMNRLRGQLNLGTVSDIFAGLINDGTDLEALISTGFSSDEVDNLIEAATRNPDDDMPVEMEAAAPPKDTDRAQWDLEILFSNRADRDRARRALRKLAGKGNELQHGLLRLVDNEQGEGDLELLLDAAQMTTATRGDSEAHVIALKDLSKVISKITKRRGRKEKS